MNYFKVQKEVLLLMLLIFLSIAFAWILEIWFHMEPCSLCLLQRFGLYISLFVLFFYCLINYFKKITVINIVLLLLSLTGIIFSLIAGLRQTYIQMLPADKVPSCGADLNTLLQFATPLEAVRKVFEGSGECAEKAFVFIGLSLANWATILFFALFVFNLIILVRKIIKK